MKFDKEDYRSLSKAGKDLQRPIMGVIQRDTISVVKGEDGQFRLHRV